MTVDDYFLWAFWTAFPFLFTKDYLVWGMWMWIFHYGIAQNTYDLSITYVLFMTAYLYFYMTRVVPVVK